MRDFRVIALIAAFNEADILAEVVEDLVKQGVHVYVIDDGSEDDTVANLQRFLNNGLLAIERRPLDAPSGLLSWEQLLRRKQELANELDADWFVHHDADEFRESPWSGMRLVDAIRHVDRRGYNAIDFHLMTFQPTHDEPERAADIRSAFTRYERPASWDRKQVKCWKKTLVQVDLVSSGGHDVAFPERRVFPIRFLLRHYPIRGQAHGERKVFVERKPRFSMFEREKQWHVQYDGIQPGDSFIRLPSELIAYDPDAIRVDLTLDNSELSRSLQDVKLLADEVAALQRELEHTRDVNERLTVELGGLSNEVRITADRHERERQHWTSHSVELTAEVTSLRKQLRAMYLSMSWRITQPLRMLYGLLRGK